MTSEDVCRLSTPIVSSVVDSVLVDNGVIRATKYLTPNLVLRATRRRYGKRILRGKNVPIELHVALSRPNYLEQRFIKACLKAGESFPIKKVQLKWDECTQRR